MVKTVPMDANPISGSAGPLRIVGPLSYHSGYSKMARGILRAALLAGYDVQAVESDLRVRMTRWGDGRTSYEPYLPVPEIPLPPMQDDEVQAAMKNRVPDGSPTLLIQSPWNLSAWPHYGDAPTIALTMTESDNLCQYWRHGFRCVDYVAAPSSYVLDTYQRVVPEVPTGLLPLAADERIWSDEGFVDAIPHQPPFLFLAVFNVSERKNWRMLMTAFLEEFSTENKEVGLIVKATGHVGEVLALADSCRSGGAWVQVDTDRRTDHMMGALYRNCHVYVQPSSEGFGLPYVEAALCGLPSVALALGGAADVVNEATGYLVPSKMEPIIGHMPHAYDRREHNFAACDIEDLKATLRRAYDEEKAGAAKGKLARDVALQYFTPQAIAPYLRTVIDAGRAAFDESQEANTHPVAPKWVTVAGAWGDVMCAIGTARAMMQTKEIEKIGVIWYGKDTKIAEWLKCQPWVREVLPIIEPDKDRMTMVYGQICQVKPRYARATWETLLARRGVELTGEIAYTQLCLAEDRTPEYWHGAVLPDEANAWAQTVADGIGEPYILLNPLSVASNTMRDHWPHWSEAIGWLLENLTCPVVMVGENLIEWPAHPRLVNVSGQTPSMVHVLALADRSAGIVTTSNNLAHYAVIQEIPTVCIAARTFHRRSFYHRYNEVEPLTIVDFEEPASDMERAVQDRFQQFMADTEPGRDVVTENEYYGLGRPA